MGHPSWGKQHGLHVVDVGDGEWMPVFSYDHSRARDRARRGGRPDRSPFEVQGTAPSRTLGGRLALGGTIHDSEHGDTRDGLVFLYVSSSISVPQVSGEYHNIFFDVIPRDTA